MTRKILFRLIGPLPQYSHPDFIFKPKSASFHAALYASPLEDREELKNVLNVYANVPLLIVKCNATTASIPGPDVYYMIDNAKVYYEDEETRFERACFVFVAKILASTNTRQFSSTSESI